MLKKVIKSSDFFIFMLYLILQLFNTYDISLGGYNTYQLRGIRKCLTYSQLLQAF